MSSRLRYGPRFQPTIADRRYRYDESVAKGMTYPGLKFASKETREIWEARRHSREVDISLAGMVVPGKERSRRGNRALNAQRDAAEEVMAEHIISVIQALEFGLREIGTQFDARWDRVNLLGVHDAISALKFHTGPMVKKMLIEKGMAEKSGGYVTSARVKARLEHVCVGCGGPARIEIHSEWFCEDCQEQRT